MQGLAAQRWYHRLPRTREGEPNSVVIFRCEKLGDINIVMARATTPDNRTNESIGTVAIGDLRANALVNAEEER